MNQKLFTLGLLMGGAVLALTGCNSTPLMTKAQRYPLMYEEKPHVVVVLPPINSSTAADAKEYYATTVAMPLAMAGYYVVPSEITGEILKREGLYDTEILAGQPLNKFYDYFGADAVLIPHITKWDKSYLVIASNLTVSVDAQLRSTHTNRVLWDYKGTVVVNLSGSSSSGNLIADLIVTTVATAIKTAMADYVPIAQQANFMMFSSLPAGKYRTAAYLKDQDVKIDPSGQVLARR
jgi:hypothetical protein